MIQKSTNQVTNVPILTKNFIPTLYGLSYPSARPLHIYRKQGVSNSNPTSQSFPSNCQCSTSQIVGTSFKQLGKLDNGKNKTDCCPSIIKTATTNLSPTYYSNYSAYLKKRGNTYSEKSLFHTIPGVNYTLPPSDQLPDSSCFEQNGVVDIPACKRTIYKPNNPGFSTEGSVQSSAYVDRVKYNAITGNNASFNRTYNVRFGYTTDTLFFVKNKTALPCYAGKCSPANVLYGNRT
jgi:hypothetical protein